LHRLIKRRGCLTSLCHTSEKQEFRQQIKRVLNGMIETLKAIEPETGYGAILKLSEAEESMRSGLTIYWWGSGRTCRVRTTNSSIKTKS
jgi:hypothetical protein